MKNKKYLLTSSYEDLEEDPVLGKHDLVLAINQRDQKIKEEYEAFNNMHDADGINTSSVRSREL